ncbi:BA75_00411T0 [Komagataella pastoris]|uniref:Translation machinery-associated protein 22 n=1 Tax=Komagataella pastoris TaxID=4922 RepID=A0A1B2J6N0_PICPA|nr:BA75_00411T0 [Komagataella pastoris]
MAEVQIAPKEVIYCEVCSFPPEYCEFGGTFNKCKAWLEEEHPQLFQSLYSADALAAATSSLSLEKEEKISQDLQKKRRKEEKKQERELQQKLASKVLIKKIARTKRKQVIAISGLEVFNIDMKKLAKTFASKFATGASVTKNLEKKDEIIIQGDVGDEVEQYILELLEKDGLTEVKVEQVDEKPKKKKPTAPGTGTGNATST